jgi:hypothetical protein
LILSVFERYVQAVQESNDRDEHAPLVSYLAFEARWELQDHETSKSRFRRKPLSNANLLSSGPAISSGIDLVNDHYRRERASAFDLGIAYIGRLDVRIQRMISEALSCVVAVGNVFYPALEGSVEVERNDRHRRELSDVTSG